MRVRDLGEFGVIERIARLTGAAGGAVLGIGDDTAVLDTGGPNLLLATIDIQVEGEHFLFARSTPYQVGRRAAAVNLSDVGAMGGQPRWALVSLALPPDLEVAWVEEFYRGLGEELTRFGATVVGGNLSSSKRIVVDVALLAEATRDGVVLREGARPGDALLVTGTLGRAAAGHFALEAGLDLADPAVAACVAAQRTPTARVGEGIAIARTRLATAMLDLSDGLSSDLGHICERSAAGAEVDAGLLPIDPHVRQVAERLGLSPLELATSGGEDYELLFTAPPEVAAELQRAVAAVAGVPVTRIGRITAPEEGRRLLRDGRSEPFSAAGWDHFRDGYG